MVKVLAATFVVYTLMSRIERKYCLMSTSCLIVLFGISILPGTSYLTDFGVFW